MEDNLTSDLKEFFADRVPPPAETRTALTRKLAEAQRDIERRRTIGQCLLVLLYAMLFSASILGIAWVFFGAGIIVLAVLIYLSASITAGLAIVLAFKSLLAKGGNACDAVMD
ncbi:MAG: hypothetical protein FWE91_10555 [Defluviitaleaceae bacterium]|nr:hypothetical protein [Defluviitaleaceae bacterium]MCL2835221.1 hypothetical protein [Defluviitaleaceae bacterium]